MTDHPSVQIKIAETCDQIKELLLFKNSNYGNSALEPCRVFSKASPVEQLLVRIDDKLSRIQRGAGLVSSDEDVINDLIGYLVLLKIALERQQSTGIRWKFTHDDVRKFFEDSKWNGEDIEPIYGNNLKDANKINGQSHDEWLESQVMGHRSPD